MDNIAAAIMIATKVHAGKLRKFSYDDYIEHPLRVAAAMNTIEEKAVAWLHDVLEDDPTAAFDMGKAGIPGDILAHVIVLTRKKDESYLTYLKRVMKDPIAVCVKLADLRDNMRDLPFGSLRSKYELAEYILQEVEEK